MVQAKKVRGVTGRRQSLSFVKYAIIALIYVSGAAIC